MTEIVIRAHVLGRVQGVGYRAWARGTANRLSLRGWARNRSDGAVEVVVAGPADRVALFLEACKSGPPFAEVSAVEAAEESDPDAAGVPPAGFRISG